MKLIGPFTQAVTMDRIPHAGPIADRELEIAEEAGVLIEGGKIREVGSFKELVKKCNELLPLDGPSVAIPGFVDAHTHLCFAGSREKDYALRVSGISYQEIAARGGGILDTVSETRKASSEHLLETLLLRLGIQLQEGISTCEIKSGYGLTVGDELKMLRVIREAKKEQPIDIIPTCLAAHTIPKGAKSEKQYLQEIIDDLLPEIKKENLSNRVDIFVDMGAFSKEGAVDYLTKAKMLGFDCAVHANQFTAGGAEVAARCGATSADHLENVCDEELLLLKKGSVAPVVLPGSSLGLGAPYAPARRMLDLGLPLAVATDWNPGSAPMGRLLTQAAAIGAFEKMTIAETLAAITFRAAKALGLQDRGILKKGMRADLAIFSCRDFREILYYQGSLRPSKMVIEGEVIDLQKNETKRCGKGARHV